MSGAATGVTPSGLPYSVVGSGPPLLWLSGYVLASTALDRYVAAFSDHYTCISFDARGSGRMRPAVCRVTTASMAYDAIDVLRDAGHESAHVHGISLGGMVAQELAIRAPHRVRTLVLGATTAGGTAATPARLSTMWSSLNSAHSPVPGAESVSWRGALQQALAAGTHDAGARLRRVQAPTLVMHGDRDRLLPPENAEVLAMLIPDAQLRLIPRAGHFYPVRNTEEAAQVALMWMAGQGDVSPGARSGGQPLRDRVGDLAASPLRWTRAQLMPLRHVYQTLRHLS
jgi:3-oxoadipate enol-lactonase